MTDRIAELRAMAATVTPGLWIARRDRTIAAGGVPLLRAYAGRNEDDNIRLIVQAPTLATELADALEREAAKDAEIARLRAANARLLEQHDIKSALIAQLQARDGIILITSADNLVKP